MGDFHFTGVISIVLLRGKEYRLTTYLGAKAVKIEVGAPHCWSWMLRMPLLNMNTEGKPTSLPSVLIDIIVRHLVHYRLLS